LHGNDNLAIWLRRAGYHTAMIGKYLNGYENDPSVPRGWSEWRAAAPYTQKVYRYNLNENGTLIRYGDDRLDFKQDVLTRKAVHLVRRQAPKAQPFFLWLTYTASHSGGPDPNPHPPSNCQGSAKPAPRHARAFDSEPLPRTPNFNEADVSDKPFEIRSRPRLSPGWIADIQRRYRCRLESLLSVDDGVKSIIDELRANSELAKTVVVFTSDNGFFAGEHRLPGGKTHIYEESIRVPLVMRGPGIPRGVTVRDLSINADLAPTIVDLANASPGHPMDGRSLIPVVRQPGLEQGRQLLIEKGIAHSGPNSTEPSFAAIRTPRYLYAAHSTGERELYDLHEDPFELASRHADPRYASVRASLAARLRALRTCAGPSCRARP
jgi:arylsulfatase A-like enzyme